MEHAPQPTPAQLAEIERAIETLNAMDPAERNQILEKLTQQFHEAAAPLLRSIEETEMRGPDDWKIRVGAAA